MRQVRLGSPGVEVSAERLGRMGMNTTYRASKEQGCRGVAVGNRPDRAGGVPIPGTRRRVRYLEENVTAADIARADELSALDEPVPIGAASGDRNPAGNMDLRTR